MVTDNDKKLKETILTLIDTKLGGYLILGFQLEGVEKNWNHFEILGGPDF